MNLSITPARLSGSVTIPASKSMAHRLILGAALADGESRIERFSVSEDMEATLRAVKQLGASFELRKNSLTVRGNAGSLHPSSAVEFDCGESGSTLRFLIPSALIRTGNAVFTGRGRLMERPLDPYITLFHEKGIQCSLRERKLFLSGTLSGGTFALSGAVSSQFITGLLFALPMLPEDSEIRITDFLSSSPYVSITLDALKRFGISAANHQNRIFSVPGGQQYIPCRTEAEGDWSQAAFFLAANTLGSDIHINGLNPDSLQGDRKAETILSGYSRPGTLAIDADEIPDLVPALAAAAAFRDGQTTSFIHAGRLRLKESDRIESVLAMLRSLGADADSAADTLTVYGKKDIPGNRAPVGCCGDHRIAMAAAAASTACRREVILTGAECTAKSYPDFWKDFESLGGKLTVI